MDMASARRESEPCQSEPRPAPDRCVRGLLIEPTAADADLSGATYDAETRWPAGFKPHDPARRLVCGHEHPLRYNIGPWTGSYPPSSNGHSVPSRPHRGGWAHLWDGTARRHLTYIRDL